MRRSGRISHGRKRARRFRRGKRHAHHVGSLAHFAARQLIDRLFFLAMAPPPAGRRDAVNKMNQGMD